MKTDNDNTPYLSIIIPAYNEEKRISKTLENIVKFAESFEEDIEVIVINDCSTDNTVSVIRQFGNKLEKLEVINSTKNAGKGQCIKIGMIKASGKYILFMDADNSAPIEEVNKLLQYLNNSDYDIAIGSRYVKGSVITTKQPLKRIILSRLGNIFIRTFLVPKIRDTQCGFKLFKKEAAKILFEKSIISGFAMDIEILFLSKKYGFKVKEAPINWKDEPSSHLKLAKDSTNTLLECVMIMWFNVKGKYD